MIPASKVLDAFKRFRAHPRIASLQSESIEKINSQLNTPINRLIEHHLQDSSIVPILATEAGVTIQNLRGIYGEIAIYLFCPTEMGVHRFLQEYLGHISKRQSNFSRNSSSTEHYFHYYLVDEGGQPLTSG